MCFSSGKGNRVLIRQITTLVSIRKSQADWRKVTFLGWAETAIKSWFAVLGALGLFLFFQQWGLKVRCWVCFPAPLGTVNAMTLGKLLNLSGLQFPDL